MKSIIQYTLMGLCMAHASFTSAAVLDLGVAGKFNVFVFNDFTSSSSDVEGAVAAGGNFSANGYAVNELNKAVAGNALVVGNNLNFSNGSVNNGNINVGGTVTTSGVGFSGSYVNTSPINFTNEKTYLTQVSSNLNQLSNTGTVGYQFSGMQLTASNSSTAQIFDIDGALFNSRNTTTFSGFSSGQTIILNISGNNLTFNGGTGTNFGNNGFNVIYNFYQATALTTGSGAFGTILAPLANITGGFSAIDGNVIANSWNTNTQVNVRGQFVPTEIAGFSVTPVPEPSTYAVLCMGLAVFAWRASNTNAARRAR